MKYTMDNLLSIYFSGRNYIEKIRKLTTYQSNNNLLVN